MSIEPAFVLHGFVSLANEPDYTALGWMRERPLKPGVEKHLGVWLIWPCTTCLPVEPSSGACAEAGGIVARRCRSIEEMETGDRDAAVQGDCR
jgi:hypothetical protein